MVADKIFLLSSLFLKSRSIRTFLCLALFVTSIPASNFRTNSRTHFGLRVHFAECATPGDDKIKAYNEAAAALRASIDRFKLASAPVKADTETISESLKKINFSEAMVSQFARVVTTIKAGVSTTDGRLALLKKPQQDLDEKLLQLEAAFVPFQPCVNAENAPAVVKLVIEDAKSVRSDVAEQKKVVGLLLAAVKNVPDKANEFLSIIAEKANATARLRPTLPSQPLRSQLSENLPSLALALRLRRLFEPVAKDINTALDPKFPDLKGVVEKPDFKSGLANADSVLKKAIGKVPEWSSQATTEAQEQYAALKESSARESREGVHNPGEILALANEAEKAHTEFKALMEALEKLLNETQSDDVSATALPDGFIPNGAQTVSGSVTALQRTVLRLSGTALDLRGGLTVDKSTWAMASVDLFYFDNVERLMRVLSPNVRLVSSLNGQEFQAAANTARTRLNEVSQDLANADAEVSDRRQEVADLQERVRLANARTTAATQVQRTERNSLNREAAAAEAKERALTERRKNLDARRALAQSQLDRANAAAEAKPEDLALQRRVEVAQQELDRSTLLADEAKADEERAHDEAVAARAAANGGLSGIDQDVTDLKAQLTTAQSSLDAALTRRSAATTAQRTQLRSAFLAAQAENFAFAQARDNAPFLTNVPEVRPPAAPSASPTPTPAPPPIDTDPISRVLLFAFPDTRTIFIRGPRDDIDFVRQVIKEFDQPGGQAMMTLRTLEISSDGSSDSAKRALRFLKSVDDKLRVAQANVEGSMTYLRDQINAQVKKVADGQEATWRNEQNSFRKQIVSIDEELKKATDKLRINQLTSQKDDATNKIKFLDVRLSRRLETETTAFYDNRVLLELGWQEKFLEETTNTAFLNAVIPPPSRPVNLAQALIVLSLASSANRQQIVAKLTPPKDSKTRDCEKKIDLFNAPTKNTDRDRACKSKLDPFYSLRRFLGVEGNSSDILGFQSKLVDALRFNGITHVLEVAEAKVRLRTQLEREKAPFEKSLADLGDQFSELDAELEGLKIQIKDLNSILENPGRRTERELKGLRSQLETKKTRAATLKDDLTQIEGDAKKIQDQLGPIGNDFTEVERDLTAILSWIQGNTEGISPVRLRKRIEQAIQSTDSTSALLSQAVGLRRSARFRFSQANESAVNLTFRKYLEQVSRELSDVYVNPTFRDINETLLKEKLGVGVLQETSILASNRLVAKVDPRGSAQLAVGEEKDVLEAARQLTNLFGLIPKGLATGVTGNPLGLAGGPAGAASSTIQTAQSVLGALDQMPREAAPTVYGIATGNLFQVTPVIDPSGQALRFRFDLVSATQIREPNNTIDPMLPRIERHSINTEVQLADQEIRLISQFQANSRLGIPKRTSGGIPILKDLPGMSYVPLIGWFVKRGGRSAQTQQSFIFCQTVMYPTLSEVLDGAVHSPTFTGLEN